MGYTLEIRNNINPVTVRANVVSNVCFLLSINTAPHRKHLTIDDSGIRSTRYKLSHS